MKKLKLLLAFCLVTIAASAQDTYTVAGNLEAIFGAAWDVEATANDMTAGEDGIYTKTYEAVEIAANTTIEYKVVKNHAWDESWGFGDANANYVVNDEGTYDITFSFNPTTAFSDGNYVFCEVVEHVVLNPFTATFKNDADPAWEAVYAYTWTGDGEEKVEQLGAWPGTKLTANAEGIFEVSGQSATLPAFIIFNNGDGTEAAPKAQTVDLAFVEGKEYFYWGEHEFTYQKYLVKNIASGKYWAQANDWGTRASLVPNAEYLKLVPIRNSQYNIESQVNNGGSQYYFDGDYMDNGNPTALTITEVADGKYTIANGINYYGWDGTSTVLGKNLAADSENALWTIVSLADAKTGLTNATVNDPIDATFLIEDHNFGRNNRYSNNWTGTGLKKGGDNSNLNSESYMAAFDLSQTLSEVPNGIYELKAQAAVTYHDNRAIKEYDGQGAPVIYANTESSDFIEMMAADQLQSQAKLSGQFTAGEYYVSPVFVQVTDGTLKIGAKSERADIWAVFDNFTLTYYGADATLDEVKNAAILAEMRELKANAEELAKDMEIANVKNALDEAVAQAADAQGADAINAAIDALKAAIESAEAFNKAKDVLPKMKQLVDNTNVYTEDAYNEYYGQWIAKYEAGTLTTAEANALQDPFLVTGWHAAINCDNFLLSAWDTNPDFKDAPYYINTWSVEGNNDGTEFKVPFFEYYTNANVALGEKTLTATMTGLVPGWYKVSAWVRVATLENAETADGYGISLQVNEGTAVNVCDGNQIVSGSNTNQRIHGNFTAYGIVGLNGELKIKFNVAAENNIHWLSFKNVNFTKFEPVYAVVGSKKGDDADKAIFSGGWDAATQTDILTQNGKAYSKTYADQKLDAQTIAYKFIAKESLDATEAIAWYPTGDNLEISIPVKGQYDIAFTFDGTNVTGAATKTAEAVTISDKGWATTVTNSALNFSAAEVEAYTATVADNKVVLKKVDDDVQEETGLVLKGTAGTYYIPVAASSETDKGSLMFSSTLTYDIWQPTDGTVNTFYGLTVNAENEAQFVKISEGTIPAQKAFLMINTPAEGARTLDVVFAGETTGINAIAAQKNAEMIFNMNGQRVAAPAKGLYIMNGKKVMVK